jgi:hypothetical protein
MGSPLGDPAACGTPEAKTRSRSLARVRFWAKVDRRDPEECWPWKAVRDSRGYGVFWTGEHNTKAHRFAWAEAHGRPPRADEAICHRCDNPPCCNPAHLFAGTWADNRADTVSKGRQARGSAWRHSKLTAATVREIRALYRPGDRDRGSTGLARRYGVDPSLINRVVRGELWKHI